MRIRTFIVAYALVLAILLFADRRPRPAEQPRYSHVVDLTDGQDAQISIAQPPSRQNAGPRNAAPSTESQTRIVAPDALIPGTWTPGQIPPERLIAPLVVMDVDGATASQISLDEIAAWEAQHGVVPQGAVVAIRRTSTSTPEHTSTSSMQPASMSGRQYESTSGIQPPVAFPITAEAAQFLMDARYTTGFAIETTADFHFDRALSRQIGLHGNYVVEGASHLTTLPATGSLIIVAPAKNRNAGGTAVRVLAMAR